MQSRMVPGSQHSCRLRPGHGMAGYLSSRGGGSSPSLQGGVDLGHGGRAIGLALAVEPLLMGAETGDPRPDLGLEILPQVGTGKGNRPRYLPCRFPGHFYCRRLSYRWRLRRQVAFPPAGTQCRKGLRRKGLRPDGWFRMSRRRAGRPTRDRLLGLRRLAGHRLNERHRLRDQEIAFLHPFHETPRPESLHQTAFVEASAVGREPWITAALLRAR